MQKNFAQNWTRVTWLREEALSLSTSSEDEKILKLHDL